MTAQEVLETVAAVPQEDWMKIQCGIAELITVKLSSEEIAEIRGDKNRECHVSGQ